MKVLIIFVKLSLKFYIGIVINAYDISWMCLWLRQSLNHGRFNSAKHISIVLSLLLLSSDPASALWCWHLSFSACYLKQIIENGLFICGYWLTIYDQSWWSFHRPCGCECFCDSFTCSIKNLCFYVLYSQLVRQWLETIRLTILYLWLMGHISTLLTVVWFASVILQTTGRKSTDSMICNFNYSFPFVRFL